MPNSRVVSVRIPQSMRDQVNAVAAISGESANAFIVRATEVFIAAQIKTPEFKRQAKAHLAAAIETVRRATGEMP